MGRSKAPRGPKSSIYTGVYFHKVMKRYVAQYKTRGVSYYLGAYEKEIDAANAYDYVKYQAIKRGYASNNILGGFNFDPTIIGPEVLNRCTGHKRALYCPGLTFYKSRSKFKVLITAKKQEFFVGCYADRADAIKAGLDKVKELLLIYPDCRTLKRAFDCYDKADSYYNKYLQEGLEEVIKALANEEIECSPSLEIPSPPSPLIFSSRSNTPSLSELYLLEESESPSLDLWQDLVIRHPVI